MWLRRGRSRFTLLIWGGNKVKVETRKQEGIDGKGIVGGKGIRRKENEDGDEKRMGNDVKESKPHQRTQSNLK